MTETLRNKVKCILVQSGKQAPLTWSCSTKGCPQVHSFLSGVKSGLKTQMHVHWANDEVDIAGIGLTKEHKIMSKSTQVKKKMEICMLGKSCVSPSQFNPQSFLSALLIISLFLCCQETTDLRSPII